MASPAGTPSCRRVRTPVGSPASCAPSSARSTRRSGGRPRPGRRRSARSGPPRPGSRRRLRPRRGSSTWSSWTRAPSLPVAADQQVPRRARGLRGHLSSTGSSSARRPGCRRRRPRRASTAEPDRRRPTTPGSWRRRDVVVDPSWWWRLATSVVVVVSSGSGSGSGGGGRGGRRAGAARRPGRPGRRPTSNQAATAITSTRRRARRPGVGLRCGHRRTTVLQVPTHRPRRRSALVAGAAVGGATAHGEAVERVRRRGGRSSPGREPPGGRRCGCRPGGSGRRRCDRMAVGEGVRPRSGPTWSQVRAGSMPARQSVSSTSRLPEPGQRGTGPAAGLQRGPGPGQARGQLPGGDGARLGSEPAGVGVELQAAEAAGVADAQLGAVGEGEHVAVPGRSSPCPP